MIKMIKIIIQKLNWFIRLIEGPDERLIYAFDDEIQRI
ncbi:hypothetical protein lilo_0641 [Lactococcus lactis subsp. lactis IO-1]|jgi:hypothetical protein|nr:hypothetical protein lilo_0641 [Lactococcus lactis subsp. lactis IO-1]